MPSFLQGVNYLSPARYAIRNLAPYSLRGMVFTCTEAQQLPNGECIISTGEDVLKLYSLDKEAPWINLVGIGVCAVVYRLLAYALLKVIKGRWSWRKFWRKKEG